MNKQNSLLKNVGKEVDNLKELPRLMSFMYVGFGKNL